LQFQKSGGIFTNNKSNGFGAGLSSDEITRTERERSYEYNLPGYLQHDLDAYKDGLKNKSNLLDCLWGELYGSINAAQINDGAITPEHADYLRQKYLFGKK